MNALKIHSIDGKGDLGKECVWLSVDQDAPDISFYLLCDTTFTAEDKISNELRHMYWFNKMPVKKGDWVRLWTKNGTNDSVKNEKGTMTHNFFWNLGKTVWNKDGDAVTLFNLESWKTTRV